MSITIKKFTPGSPLSEEINIYYDNDIVKHTSILYILSATIAGLYILRVGVHVS